MINLSQSQQTSTLQEFTSRCKVKGTTGEVSPKETKSKDMNYGGKRSTGF